MFKLFRRAMAKAAKRAASANVRAATKALRELAAPRAKPPRKRPAAAKSVKADPAKPRVRKPKAVGEPRRGLAETIAWIEAGGMPARPPAARTKTTVPRGASFKLASYASDQGKRSYKLYIPAKSKVGPQPCAPMPLVVMLHGCGQTPDDFAAGTRMNALAEEFGLLVAYPSQPRAANSNRCWNWFERSDQVRGTGEPSLIAGIARTILRDHPADPARVYIAGLSAGGSAAIIAATAYPDLFAAVGVHSGLPAGAAHNAASGFIAMQAGRAGRPANRRVADDRLSRGRRHRGASQERPVRGCTVPVRPPSAEEGRAQGPLARWPRLQHDHASREKRQVLLRALGGRGSGSCLVRRTPLRELHRSSRARRVARNAAVLLEASHLRQAAPDRDHSKPLSFELRF